MAQSNRMRMKTVVVFLMLVLGGWLLWSWFWKFLCVPTVNSIAFSPNGQLVAGAGGWLTPHDGDEVVGALWVWDGRSGALKQRLTAHLRSMSVLQIVAFSEDGSTVAAWQQDGRKFLWDVESGQLLQVQEPSALQNDDAIRWTQQAGESSTDLLPFKTSPSGNRVLSQRDAIRHGAMLSGVKRTLAQFPHEQVRALSANSRWMVTHQPNTRSLNGTLRIRELAKGKAFQALPEELCDSRPLKFSPDNKLLALQQHGGATPSPLRFWDLHRRQLLRTFNSRVTAPQSLAFSPDSTTIVESGGYGEVEMWDVNSGRRLHRWAAG